MVAVESHRVLVPEGNVFSSFLTKPMLKHLEGRADMSKRMKIVKMMIFLFFSKQHIW